MLAIGSIYSTAKKNDISFYKIEYLDHFTTDLGYVRSIPSSFLTIIVFSFLQHCDRHCDCGHFMQTAEFRNLFIIVIILITNEFLKFNESAYIPSQVRIITSRNNAPISNYGGGFRCKSEYPWCIIKVKS
ncbi:Uncharacterized protein FWK35_00004887 [Aphis craccivora]|uniref:Uncharacterized protein n=1 Tax=Aphis craccivora TaxID=307492 RepID=A0A6G0Z4Y2_APHCR|nr:Uncharacterized protein FWK35_00004887 [Aphis craccivora]